MFRRLALLAAVLLAVGCAETPRQVDGGAVSPPAAVPAGETAWEAPRMKPSTLRLLASRNIQVQANRPVNIASECTHKDEVGTRTRLSLQVEAALVKAFNAEVAIKGRGSCRFDLAEFEQVQQMPQVLLRHRREDKCQVRMWEEGAKVTVAFNSCPRSCEGKAFDYLWPIVVETKSGRCY